MDRVERLGKRVEGGWGGDRNPKINLMLMWNKAPQAETFFSYFGNFVAGV